MEKTKAVKEIREYAIDRLEELKDSDIQCCDVHNELFNTDYYIIGTYKAKEWLGSDVFEAIEEIKEYEQDNFREVTTDLSNPERVVNMYVYILGEEILQESDTLKKEWDNILDNEILEGIIEDLKG